MYILSFHASQPHARGGPEPHQHTHTNTCTVGSLTGLPSAGLHKANPLPFIFSSLLMPSLNSACALAEDNEFHTLRHIRGDTSRERTEGGNLEHVS